MTNEENEQFKKLFGKFCEEEIKKGHCYSDCCDVCEIQRAYDMIFSNYDKKLLEINEDVN